MKSFFTAAAAALSLGIAGLPAQASGCYRALAADDIAYSIRGGLTPQQALQIAYDRGNIDGSTGCTAMVLGYMRSLHPAYSDIVRK